MHHSPGARGRGFGHTTDIATCACKRRCLLSQTPKTASIIKAFISYIQCFIAYCFKNVDIISKMKQKGMHIYIMQLNDIIKHINEESYK